VPLASAHVGLTPAGITAGTDTRVALEIPNERRGHVTTGLEIRLPEGVAVVAAAPVSGWTAATSAETVTWSGGRIEGPTATTFYVTLRAEVAPGTYALALRQGYEDERVVETESSFTVLPAAREEPKQHLGRALIAGAVGIVVVAGGLLGLHRLRRRSARV
jgi:uncharacterized protein YcnI